MERSILRTLGHLATGVGFRGHHCHQVALPSSLSPPPVPTFTTPSPQPQALLWNILCLECLLLFGTGRL